MALFDLKRTEREVADQAANLRPVLLIALIAYLGWTWTMAR